MARSIHIDTVQIYRALIEEKNTVTGEWYSRGVFGPYVTRGAYVDRGARRHRARYEEGTRRVRRQKLVAVAAGLLEWKDC
jgi:hypothetical protein